LSPERLPKGSHKGLQSLQVVKKESQNFKMMEIRVEILTALYSMPRL